MAQAAFFLAAFGFGTLWMSGAPAAEESWKWLGLTMLAISAVLYTLMCLGLVPSDVEALP